MEPRPYFCEFCGGGNFRCGNPHCRSPCCTGSPRCWEEELYFYIDYTHPRTRIHAAHLPMIQTLPFHVQGIWNGYHVLPLPPYGLSPRILFHPARMFTPHYPVTLGYSSVYIYLTCQSCYHARYPSSSTITPTVVVDAPESHIAYDVVESVIGDYGMETVLPDEPTLYDLEAYIDNDPAWN